MKYINTFENFSNYLSDYIEIDGISYSTKNSNNDYIASNIEELSNFYKWFGKSKNLDSEKRPVVCYHGSYSNFNIFKPSKSVGTHNEPNQIEGIYFTSNKEGASFFALSTDERFLKSVYLSFQNPYISKTHNSLKEEIGVKENSEVNTELKRLGYDSLILENGFHALGTHVLYLAFYPTQIKSINNDGSWDINDSNIYS